MNIYVAGSETTFTLRNCRNFTTKYFSW